MSTVKKPSLLPHFERPLSKKVIEILDDFEEKIFKIKAPEDINDRPMYGTTLYLATIENVQMAFGVFRAYIFQDIVHKGYIIALTCGNVFKEKTLYARVHSSCITSETLRGCDCDCFEQLEGSLELIAKKGKGVVFYLMQEGRGVGYVAKARDRMLVQACNDEITTFEAYNLLGLKKDYRQYRNVKPICMMLGIDAKFIMLTNNPDKIEKMKALGVKIKRAENLEFTPSPYNLAYLTSKMEAGHRLKQPRGSKALRARPPERVLPFKPYALDNAKRFIKVASYFLPIRPIDDEIVLTKEEYKKILNNHTIDELIEAKNPLLLSYQFLRKNRYKVKVHHDNLKKFQKENPTHHFCFLLHLPYWFRVHVYFDVVTDEDFVVLTYGEIGKHDIPIVRIQSESLFNRFPLIDTDNRDRYHASVKKIVEYGSGMILQLYSDGRGAGLGAYAQDMMLTQQGLSSSSGESYKRLGVDYDLRDYRSALNLLQRHLPKNAIQMVINSPSSLVRKPAYTNALHDAGIEVTHWIFLEEISKHD